MCLVRPFPGDTFKIEPTDLHNLCMILKTAMYMAETVPNVRARAASLVCPHLFHFLFAQLGESIRSLIDDAYKEHVLFTDLQEYYQFEVVSKAMRVLVCAVCLVLP